MKGRIMNDCIDINNGFGPCSGEVAEYPAPNGTSTYFRCETHQARYFELHNPTGLDASECISYPDGCTGPVFEYTSRSGCTVAARCQAHHEAHEAHVDQVQAGLNERYPGWDIPGSMPPADFDPAYAGESWDEE